MEITENIYSTNLLETVTPRQLNRLTLAAMAEARRMAGTSAETFIQYAGQRVIEVLDSRQARAQARLAEILMRD